MNMQLPDMPIDGRGNQKGSIRDLSKDELVEQVIALRQVCGLLLSRFNEFKNRGETSQALETRLVGIETNVDLHTRRLAAQLETIASFPASLADLSIEINRLSIRLGRLELE